MRRRAFVVRPPGEFVDFMVLGCGLAADSTPNAYATQARAMERIEKSIEVNVPIRTCYDQWTQFESFPEFMEGIVEVTQLDDKRLQWVADIAGERKEWTAEIIEQRPDEVISWRSTSGVLNNGSVTFQSLGASRCKVTLIMTYEPQGAVEKIGDLLGVLRARVGGDLKRFKDLVEHRHVASGGWRGEIREGEVKKNYRGVAARTGAMADAPSKTADEEIADELDRDVKGY